MAVRIVRLGTPRARDEGIHAVLKEPDRSHLRDARAALFAIGGVSTRGLAILALWCGIAAYCQFLGASVAVSAAGLALQTLLAILILRWRFVQ